MADSRMVGTEIRKRMGAPTSHLDAAENARRSVAAVHELRRLGGGPSIPDAPGTEEGYKNLAAVHELRRLSYGE